MPPIENPFAQFALNNQSPALRLIPITPGGDDLDFVVRQIYVGVGGDVSVTDTMGGTVIHKNVPTGAYLGPFMVRRVNATGTTASSFIGYV